MKNNLLMFKNFVYPIIGEGDEDKGDGEDKDNLAAEKIAALSESIARLEEKNRELLGENKKTKESLKAWDGYDSEKIKSMMEHFDKNEDLKLIADGKYEEVINKRTEKVVADFNSQIEALNKQNHELTESASRYQGKISDLMIDNGIVSEFIAADGIKTATDDVKFRAKQIWKLESKDGKDEYVPRDSNGKLLTGKNGVLTPKEWIENLRETAPHLFPQSKGSGSGGGNGQGLTGIDAKIVAARNSGDVGELRRLRKQKETQGNKE